jgi:hypothetical protein
MIDSIKCEVEQDRTGHLTVTFEDGKDIYLQSDYEIAQFAVDCGEVQTPDDWDGQPDNLPESWWEIEWEDITECPDYYKNNAE